MNPVFVPWGVEMALITWRSIRNNHHAPLPSEFLATFAVFGALSLVPQDSDYGPVAMWAGWGFVVATLIAAGSPNSSSSFAGLVLNPTNRPGVQGYVAPPGSVIA